MNVLLVTGSRSLAAITAARSALATVLLPMLVTTPIVIAGDAQGPDLWALELAERRLLAWRRWCLDGYVETASEGVRASCWWNPKDPRPPSQRWPLARNRAMVESVASEHRDGMRVLCVGFVDPHSRTRGTEHTLGLARRAGIWTAKYVWMGEGFEVGE